MLTCFNARFHALTLAIVTASVAAHADDSATPNVQAAAPAVTPVVVAASRQIDSVTFTGTRVFTEEVLRALVANDLGRMMTLKEMQAVAAKVQAHYHQAGYRLAKVVVPQQSFADGRLDLLVLEGWLNRIDVTGAKRTSPSIVSDALVAQGVKPEQPFELQRVERALLHLNRLSGIEATSTLRPGKQQGSTDIQVSLKESPRVRGVIEVNNHGSKNTGETRVIPAVELSNLTGKGDVLSLLALTTVEQGGTYFVRMGYTRPVTARGGRVSAYVGQGNSEVGGQFNALDIRGENASVGIGYQQDIVRSARTIHTLELWLEAQNLEQSFLGTSTFDDRIRKLRATYSIDHSERRGRTLFNVSLHQGLGKALGGMENDSPMSSRAIAGADNQFTKLSFDLAQVYSFSPRFRLIPQVSGQYAFDSLVSSEQWGIGGYGSVVGHTLSAFSGDSGITLSAEARYQFLAHAPAWQLIGRIDNGFVMVKDTFIGQESSNEISGALIGVMYAPGNGLELRLDYAQPLGDETEDSAYVYGQARYRY